MKLADEAIAGVAVEVHVGTTGRFSITTPDGEALGSGDTLEAAKDAARRVLAKRKVRVYVPFRFQNGLPGVATGLHARTRKVLVTRDGLRGPIKEQHSAYGHYFRADTPDDVFKEMDTLEREIEVRQAQLRDLRKINGLDLGRAVTQAIEEAAEEAAAKAAERAA